MKRLLSLLLLLVLLIACTAPVVKRGDYVLVTYTGRYMNGTIFDTNDPKLVGEIQAPASHFTSLPVLVGASQVVPGFENALIGMKEGSTKNVIIKATDAYGGYDPTRAVTVPKRILFPREVHIQRTVVTPAADFMQKMGVAAVLPGTVFETQNFEYNVTAVNATDITLYIVAPTKEPVNLEGAAWNSTLVDTTSKTLVYMHLVSDNRTYMTQYGPTTSHLNASHILLTSNFAVGQEYNTPDGVGRVTTETENTITIDFNHMLAGQNLNFTITVNTIQEKK
jgi:FKBP-type peptidyl-prolyl cis-trans isomerase 2